MVGPRARNPLRSNRPTRGQATAVGSASNHANSRPVAKMVQIRCGFIDSSLPVSSEPSKLSPASEEAGAVGGDELADGAEGAGEGGLGGASRLAEAARECVSSAAMTKLPGSERKFHGMAKMPPPVPIIPREANSQKTIRDWYKGASFQSLSLPARRSDQAVSSMGAMETPGMPEMVAGR
jgi:hypothetical protein